MAKTLPMEAVKVAARISREKGIPLDDLLHDCSEIAEEIDEKRRSPDGKYRILRVNKLEDRVEVFREYSTASKALGRARSMTDEAKKGHTDYASATVFLAYDPKGNYIGGDTWVGE